MRASSVLPFFSAALAMTIALPAQTAKVRPAPSKGIAARSSEVEKKVRDLTTAITWHDSLREAKATAKRSGKPIFWMHMLGDLAGST